MLPTEHLTDTNYAEAKQFVQSRQQYGIDLIAPTRADHKWQAKEQQGFDESLYQIDWEVQKATCPAGRASLSWTPAIDRYDNAVIKIKFSMKDCKPCPLKQRCTKAQRRTISVRVKEHHQALQDVRARQKKAEFWEKYRSRSGIEGTISKASAGLWFASQSLSVHGENAFAALGECDSDQPGANLGLVRWRASCHNTYVEIRCVSFGCLRQEVRQQYHFR